jgi:hypothetical protein
MKVVHDVAVRIDGSVGFQPSSARVVTADVGLRAAYQHHFKVRGLLVGKEAVEDMIALVRVGWRHVDGQTGIAVEVAAHDPERGDGLVREGLVLVEWSRPHPNGSLFTRRRANSLLASKTEGQPSANEFSVARES